MSGGGGGSKSTTTVQKADPWKNVQDDLTSVYNALAYQYGTPSFNKKGEMQGFTLGQGPQYYPGSTVATPSGVEQWGQQQQFGQLGNAYNMAGQGMNAIGNLVGAAGATGYGNNYAANAMNEMAGAGKNMQDTGFWQSNNAYNQLSNAAGATSGMGGQAGMLGSQLGGHGNWMQGVGAGNFLQGMGSLQSGANDLAGRGQYIQDVGFNNGAIPAIDKLMAAGDPSSNPYFQSAVQSAIRPVTQQFQEQVMPSIKSGAIAAGQQGSSRQGVAEGIASRGYMDTVGDITANMGNQAYAQGLQAMQAAGGLGSQLTSLGGGQIGQAAGLQGQLAGLGSQFAGQGLGALGQSGGLSAQLGGLGSQFAGQGLEAMGGGAGVLSGLYGQGLGAAGSAGALGQGMLGTGVGAIGASGSLGSDIYGQGLDASARGAALAPSVQQSLFAPGTTTERIGQQQTQDAQDQLNAEIARWNYNQNLPYSQMADYLGLLQGAAGGTTASSMTPNSGSLLGRVGGGALMGYGMTSNPWGALAGGLLGLF